MVRNVFPVPLSPARQMAFGSSSRPKYFASIGCRSTWSLNESMRMLNSLSRPIRFAGENLSGGYSLSKRSWIFRILLGESVGVLHQHSDLLIVLVGVTNNLLLHRCLARQDVVNPSGKLEIFGPVYDCLVKVVG